jgi:hypothetical protein
VAARLVAAVGAVLAIVGIFLDAAPSLSYWDFDGTVAWTGLILAGAALLLVAASFAGRALNGWLFATGAVLAGYWAWLPAVTAFDDWDQTRAGMWLCLGGSLLIAVGAAVLLVAGGEAASTPPGMSFPALVAGVGIVLVFPGIFLNAQAGVSYWHGPPLSGHSLGILMLILAVLSAAAWGATFVGIETRGLDAAFTLAALGIVGFNPVQVAFDNLGDLQVGAWLALAGGILAAGGTWAARGIETPQAAPAAA